MKGLSNITTHIPSHHTHFNPYALEKSVDHKLRRCNPTESIHSSKERFRKLLKDRKHRTSKESDFPPYTSSTVDALIT